MCSSLRDEPENMVRSCYFLHFPTKGCSYSDWSLNNESVCLRLRTFFQHTLVFFHLLISLVIYLYMTYAASLFLLKAAASSEFPHLTVYFINKVTQKQTKCCTEAWGTLNPKIKPAKAEIWTAGQYWRIIKLECWSWYAETVLQTGPYLCIQGAEQHWHS